VSNRDDNASTGREPYATRRSWAELWQPDGDGLEVQYQWLQRWQGQRLVSTSDFPLRRRMRGELSQERAHLDDLASILSRWTTGDRELGQHVLGHLHQGGGLKTLRRHVVKQGRTVLDLDRVLYRLAAIGLVVLEERNRQTNREDYELASVRLDDRSVRTTRHFLGLGYETGEAGALYATVSEALKRASTAPWNSAGSAATAEGSAAAEARAKLEEVLRAQLAFLEKARNASPDSSRLTLPSPELVELMCRVLLITEPVPERILSIELFADSKRLSALRRPFKNAVGLELEDFGVYRHSHLLYFAGPLTFRLGETEFSGTSITPFWVLPEPALAELVVVEAPTAVLLVENQTCFEELGRFGLAEAAGVLAIFTAGYLSGPERELIELCLAAGSDRILAWMDPDPWGVDIAVAIQNEFGDRATVVPVLMNPETFDALEQKSPLEEADEKLIPRLRERLHEHPSWSSTLLGLLDLMETTGQKGEQEELLRLLAEEQLLAYLARALGAAP